jgi:hypothetical protein
MKRKLNNSPQQSNKKAKKETLSLNEFNNVWHVPADKQLIESKLASSNEEDHSTFIESIINKNEERLEELRELLHMNAADEVHYSHKMVDVWHLFEEFYDRVKSMVHYLDNDITPFEENELYCTFCYQPAGTTRKCTDESCKGYGVHGKIFCHLCKRVSSHGSFPGHQKKCQKIDKKVKKYKPDQTILDGWKLFVGEAGQRMPLFSALIKGEFKEPEQQEEPSLTFNEKNLPIFPTKLNDDTRHQHHALYKWILDNKPKLLEGKGFICGVCLAQATNTKSCKQSGCGGKPKKFCSTCRCVYSADGSFKKHKCIPYTEEDEEGSEGSNDE